MSDTIKNSRTDSMRGIEESFTHTSGVVLGTPLSGIDTYKDWLWEGIRGRVETKKSKISDKPVKVASLEFFQGMGDNVLALDESLEWGKLALPASQVETLTLANAPDTLKTISLTTPEIIYGKNVNANECACYGPTQDCYRSTFCWFSQRVAYSFWPRTSNACFGCSNVVDCQYSIRCFSSTRLTRCLEMSDCQSCSDAYYCHNSENLQDCMFCFNAKNMRYAIGNVEYPKEEYMEMKKRLLGQMATQLQAKHKLKWNIFNIGAKQAD